MIAATFLAIFATLVIQKAELKSIANTDSLNEWWTTVSTTNPKYEATTALLNSIQGTFPDLVQIYSIGKSVEGREQWVVKLSENVKNRTLLKPPMKIVANMHGDETLGRALTLMLLVDLLKNYDKKDPRATKILQNTELHLLPSVNPDGFEASVEGECSPDAFNKVGRVNGNLKDLNRDFPDQFVTKEASFEGRQPETVNIMKWVMSHYFVLSANLHALTVVASYPFDSVSLTKEKEKDYPGKGYVSKSPDHDILYFIAYQYAKKHKTMAKYNECSKGEFKDGVINGAEWYNVRGGMQDFNYHHSNAFEITFELSCCKFVDGQNLLEEWGNNKESLYFFVEVPHMALKGLVMDKDRKGIKNAAIHVREIDHTVKTTPNGEYWRLLMPGKYQVWATAKGYKSSEEVQIVIKEGVVPKRHDFKLKAAR